MEREGYNSPMLVSELGEFGLIDRLQAVFTREAPGLEVGIGDDCAVWRCHGLMVATTDTLVEDVHFRTNTISWSDLGWKSLAVNLSDVGSMGARPLYALLTLGLRSVTLHGVVEEEQNGPPLLRDAARPGQLVSVTGSLGRSAAGLCVLGEPTAEWDEPLASARAALVRAHNRPYPRVREGMALRRLGVRVGQDVSDGPLGDLKHIAERSRVGIEVDAALIPVDRNVETVYPQEALALALTGGEEYELLFAAEPALMAVAQSELSAMGTRATVIGRVVEGPAGAVVVRNQQGEALEFRRGGYDHFAG